jgi:all-trans-retinol 13,14-reductase
MVYDVVIIGSGFGGLLCGALLSKEGMSVCIIEKNEKPGGCLQTFNRDGVVFDTGVHYLGSLSDGQDMHQLFKYIEIIDDLEIERLDNMGFDRITFRQDPTEYKLAQDYVNFSNQLQLYFPEERDGIERYVSKIQEISLKYRIANLTCLLEQGIDLQYREISIYKYIQSIIKNPRLQSVLSGNNFVYAGNEDESQLYAHAMIMSSFICGSWRCSKGGSQISNLLIKAIVKNGGKLLTGKQASKFNMANARVKSVQTTDNTVIEGKLFISDIHPALVMNMFESGIFTKGFTHRILTHKNSTSAFIVNIVLKEGSLTAFNYNHYHHNNLDVWNEQGRIGDDWPQLVSIFPSITKDNNNCIKGLSLLTYMDYKEVDPWTDTVNTVENVKSRGVDYEEFKRIHAEKLIDFAEEVIPGLQAKISSYYVSTPLTIRDYIGTPSGSLYGYTNDYKDPLSSFVGPRTKVPNFYFTGQNINLHGLLGVSLSAISTCAEICGIDYLTNKILQA